MATLSVQHNGISKSYDGVQYEAGEKLAEGKTKIVFKVKEENGIVLLKSKDNITANNAEKKHEMIGKAAISTSTACRIFEFLEKCGLNTHYVNKVSENTFAARSCDMIPIEWVTRRVATGSFLRRNPGVTEGHRFYPVKLETFYKDDAAGDPEWSKEQILSAGLASEADYETMANTTRCVFEVLEHFWNTLHCALIDMKIEFGRDKLTGEILLADVIDSDSWRLWPRGDKRLMVDKQLYRDMHHVTSAGLDTVRKNFAWVDEQLAKHLMEPRGQTPKGQVVILMGSTSDLTYGEKIAAACRSFGVPAHLRVTSAHKGTATTLHVIAEYDGLGVPIVYIAVAGRSNGLGPVTSGNTVNPVINCPPPSADWGAYDIWSSLRLPSGLACSTVLSPEGAAQCAAHMLAMHDHLIWGVLRCRQTNTGNALISEDAKLTKRDLHAGAGGDGLLSSSTATNGVH